MPDVVLGAPEEGEYVFVLVHHALPKVSKIVIGAYDETQYTRLVAWPYGWPIPTGPNTHNGPKQEGDLATFGFVRSHHLRSRMLKLGWLDVTKQWKLLVDRQRGRATEGDPERLGEAIGPTGGAQAPAERKPTEDTAPKVEDVKVEDVEQQLAQDGEGEKPDAQEQTPAGAAASQPAGPAEPPASTSATTDASTVVASNADATRPLRVVQAAEPLRRRRQGEDPSKK